MPMIELQVRRFKVVSDSMASLIAPYGSHAAVAVAKDLDAKIESLLKTAAR